MSMDMDSFFLPQNTICKEKLKNFSDDSEKLTIEELKQKLQFSTNNNKELIGVNKSLLHTISILEFKMKALQDKNSDLELLLRNNGRMRKIIIE